jgi:hypothetical protein
MILSISQYITILFYFIFEEMYSWKTLWILSHVLWMASRVNRRPWLWGLAPRESRESNPWPTTSMINSRLALDQPIELTLEASTYNYLPSTYEAIAVSIFVCLKTLSKISCEYFATLNNLNHKMWFPYCKTTYFLSFISIFGSKSLFNNVLNTNFLATNYKRQFTTCFLLSNIIIIDKFNNWPYNLLNFKNKLIYY